MKWNVVENEFLFLLLKERTTLQQRRDIKNVNFCHGLHCCELFFWTHCMKKELEGAVPLGRHYSNKGDRGGERRGGDRWQEILWISQRQFRQRNLPLSRDCDSLFFFFIKAMGCGVAYPVCQTAPLPGLRRWRRAAWRGDRGFPPGKEKFTSAPSTPDECTCMCVHMAEGNVMVFSFVSLKHMYRCETCLLRSLDNFRNAAKRKIILQTFQNPRTSVNAWVKVVVLFIYERFQNPLLRQKDIYISYISWGLLLHLWFYSCFISRTICAVNMFECVLNWLACGPHLSTIFYTWTPVTLRISGLVFFACTGLNWTCYCIYSWKMTVFSDVRCVGGTAVVVVKP